jgi:hypothetical protein
LWLGWLSFFWLASPQMRVPQMGVLILCFAAGYWMLMGALMIGEYPQLSPRVKRSLPQTFGGRALLTWFNPGSGTGYVFVVLNMAALSLMVCGIGILLYTSNLIQNQGLDLSEMLWFSALLTAYIAIYLGLSRLVVVLARQVASVGLVFSLLVTIFFVIAGMALPWIFQYWLFNYRNEDYTELQFPNWAWTLVETLDGDITGHPLVIFAVLGSAGVIFAINLGLSGREVGQSRVAAPQRVLQDDAASLPVMMPRTAAAISSGSQTRPSGNRDSKAALVRS